MTDRILRCAFLGLGAVSGSFAALYLAQERFLTLSPVLRVLLAIVLGALSGLFFVSLLFRVISLAVLRGFSALEQASAVELLAGAVGLITALLIGVLLTFPFPRQLPILGPYLPSLVTAVFGYVGLVVATRKSQEISSLLPGGAPRSLAGEAADAGVGAGAARPKVLDTSAIIDGRIFDVLQTGIVEGRLVVSGAVLAELQHIADSPDALRRARGRRGLDVLNRLRRELNRELEVDERDWPDLTEVDAKIVRLAKEIGGTVVTDDYNLNKVCELQRVPVLNLNDVANALKPAVLPGEELTLQILREGKEAGQGVGYLEDGTMVVVEGGRRFVGEPVDVVVTSVFQTAAGRMIFARPRHSTQGGGGGGR